MATVGSPAIDRDWAIGTDWHYSEYSIIVGLGSPATYAGHVSEVNAYFHASASVRTIYLLTLYYNAGNNYSIRDYTPVSLSTGKGLKTWTGLSLEVQVGDFIGIALDNAEANCSIDAAVGGGSGFARRTEDTPPFIDQLFETTDPNDILSLEGIYGLPVVTTQAVSNIEARTATGNGNVTSDGGATVTERGVCWSTSENPTTADSKAQAAAGGTGAFTAAMTGLIIATKYYVKAYAINSEGTSYGAQVDFTTKGAVFPSDAITRVTNIIHRYNRKTGGYTLELAFGEVTSDFGLPEWMSKPQPSVPEKPEPKKPKPGIPEPFPPVVPWPEPLPPPPVVIQDTPTPGLEPPTTGPTPYHRGGVVGGLESLREGFVGMGEGLAAYRAKKLAEEQAAKTSGTSFWTSIKEWWVGDS